MIAVLLAYALAASPADWVPVRWPSGDPQTLELLRDTPFNCVLLEPAHWTASMVARAREQKLIVLGVVSSRNEVDALAERGAALKLDGFVAENLDDLSALRRTGLSVVELAQRHALTDPPRDALIGTSQGVWPGINPLSDADAAVAAPTGSPWLDTNSGFLRYLRTRTAAAIWMGNKPPAGTAYPAVRYLQAIADAALAGARWVVSFDADLQRQILSRDARALKIWREIAGFSRFVEQHDSWRRWKSYGNLGLMQEPAQGAFVSGGVLDMLAVKHLPVRPVNSPTEASLTIHLAGGPVASNRVISPTPGWTFPLAARDQFAIRKADLPKLEDLYRRVTEATGRANFGLRLFNGSGMLSHPLVAPEGNRLAIPMVNYTGYPIESITLHLLGKWKNCRLIAPGRPPRELPMFPAKEGTGIDVDSIEIMAVLEVERDSGTVQ